MTKLFWCQFLTGGTIGWNRYDKTVLTVLTTIITVRVLSPVHTGKLNSTRSTLLNRQQIGNKVGRSTKLNVQLYSYSYFIEFTHQTCMKKVHDNVHKRYIDKTMLTIKTKLLKIKQAPVNKGTFIGTGGTLG